VFYSRQSNSRQYTRTKHATLNNLHNSHVHIKCLTVTNTHGTKRIQAVQNARFTNTYKSYHLLSGNCALCFTGRGGLFNNGINPTTMGKITTKH